MGLITTKETFHSFILDGEDQRGRSLAASSWFMGRGGP